MRGIVPLGSAQAGKARGMARKTRGTPRWTRDDILRDAAETFAILPRPSTAARRAFVALMREFWPDASDGTRQWVEGTLRASRHVGREVLETLDGLLDGGGAAGGEAAGGEAVGAKAPTAAAGPAPLPLIARAAGVTHREGLRVTASVAGRAKAPVAVEENGRLDVAAPPLAHEPAPVAALLDAEPERETVSHDSAGHARAVIAHLATEGSDAAPALQPTRIGAVLRAAERPALAFAELLDLTLARAEHIVSVPRARGTGIALRALGVPADAAEALVGTWRGRVPSGFAAAYAALTLDECLDAVAAWRRQDAVLGDAANVEPLRRSA